MSLSVSMTRQIGAATGHRVHVEVLGEGPGMLHHDEVGLLGVRRRAGWIREVVLHAGGMARLVARTATAPTGRWAARKMRTLGTRPLGEILFTRGGATWRGRELARVTPRLPLWRLVASAESSSPRNCWARRTLFVLDGLPILVTEVFLPALIRPPCAEPEQAAAYFPSGLSLAPGAPGDAFPAADPALQEP